MIITFGDKNVIYTTDNYFPDFVFIILYLFVLDSCTFCLFFSLPSFPTLTSSIDSLEEYNGQRKYSPSVIWSYWNLKRGACFCFPNLLLNTMMIIPWWLSSMYLKRASSASVGTKCAVCFCSKLMCTVDDLKEMGIPLGPRKKIANFVKEKAAKQVGNFFVSQRFLQSLFSCNNIWTP